MLYSYFYFTALFSYILHLFLLAVYRHYLLDVRNGIQNDQVKLVNCRKLAVLFFYFIVSIFKHATFFKNIFQILTFTYAFYL